MLYINTSLERGLSSVVATTETVSYWQIEGDRGRIVVGSVASIDRSNLTIFQVSCIIKSGQTFSVKYPLFLCFQPPTVAAPQTAVESTAIVLFSYHRSLWQAQAKISLQVYKVYSPVCDPVVVGHPLIHNHIHIHIPPLVRSTRTQPNAPVPLFTRQPR